MRLTFAPILIALTLFAAGCSRDNPPAKEAGRIAYKFSRETEKAAKKAGQELKEATHEAHQGWKEASREDKTKSRR